MCVCVYASLLVSLLHATDHWLTRQTFHRSSDCSHGVLEIGSEVGYAFLSTHGNFQISLYESDVRVTRALHACESHYATEWRMAEDAEFAFIGKDCAY